jgi:hypothetical protein
LNIEYRVRNISLREHVLALAKLGNRFTDPDLGQEGLGIKRVLCQFSQTNILARCASARRHISRMFTC